jgi:hypothetical protein
VDSAYAAAKEMPYGSNMSISANLVIEIVERVAELEKVELETVAKARKMFVVNARKFGYFDSVGHTIQELQSWEKSLKEQGK